MIGEQREYSSFVGPGWYAWVMVAGLDFIYHLSKNTQPMWLAITLAVIWGFVAWGAVSFLLWSISEYFPANDVENSTEVLVSDFESLSKKNSELITHMKTALSEDGILIGNSAIMLSTEQRQQVRNYFFKRWAPESSDYFNTDTLPPRVISKLLEQRYTTKDGNDLYRLTPTGLILFPSKSIVPSPSV